MAVPHEVVEEIIKRLWQYKTDKGIQGGCKRASVHNRKRKNGLIRWLLVLTVRQNRALRQRQPLTRTQNAALNMISITVI